MRVVFTNPGIIDLLGVRTFGVNAKENDNPIGFFGTGLKYALAVIIRNGGSVSLFRGKKEEHTFGVAKTEMRSKEFSLITMTTGGKAEELAFTTELGKTWEAWQAFRELYCNMMDERGVCYSSPLSIAQLGDRCKDNETSFIVDWPDFHKVYENKSKYFLESSPIYAGNGVEIHNGASRNIYYQGVRIGETEKACKYTYNIINPLELTEDRTIRYTFELDWRVSKCIFNCRQLQLLCDWLSAEECFVEHKMDLRSGCGSASPPEPFIEAVTLLKKQRQFVNFSALTYFAKKERENMMPTEGNLSPVEQQCLNRAIDFLTKLGYPVSKYPIVVVDNLGKDVLGQAEFNKIFISRRAFIMGTRTVAGTLFEEFTHLDKGYHDESRDFQNYLIDLVMSLGCEINKEVL